MTRSLLFSVLLGLAGASAASAAAPPVCGGVDLVGKARTEAPEAYAELSREAADVPNAEGLLWRIEAAGAAPSYLFGTMHSTEADLVALPEPLTAALAGAKAVAVELADANGAASQAEMIGYITKNAFDPAGKGLDGLTAEQGAEVGRRLASIGLPDSVARSLRPWFLAISLEISACETKRMADGLPTVDATVEAVGGKAGARIVGLETVTEQLDAVSKISDDTARRMIRDAVATPTAGDDLQATTLALYRGRKVGWYFAMKGGLLGPALDVTAYADFLEELVDRRNRLMFDRSKPLVDAGGAVVAVGALHLPGAKGLVALYRDAGYAVTRVW